jgi:RNA polymerase sigma factor (sigma-70 family)
MDDKLGQDFIAHKPYALRVVRPMFPYLDQDILEQLYIDLWPTICQRYIHDRTKLRSYVTSALINRIRNYIRDNATSHDILSRGLLESLSDPEIVNAVEIRALQQREAPTIEQDESHEIASARYNAAMLSLNPRLRILARWNFVEGIPQRDIARKLGVSQAHVARKLRKAKLLLRKWYKTYAPSCCPSSVVD